MPVRKAIAAMSGYVPGEQPQGTKTIKLNTNENPYMCSPRVKAAIGRVVQQGLHQYPDATASAFRARAAELLGVDADWILCGNGSDDILTILTRTFVNAGDLVRYASPGYVLYRALADIQGADHESVLFQPDWTLGDDFVAADDRLRLVFLANPNSPSGTTVPPSRVAEIAAALPCPLIVDEAYADFADTNCLSLVKEHDNVIITRTLSKSYALAGLRFGFAVGPPALIEQMNKVRDSYNCDALAIAGATAAIDDQNWLDKNRATILDTRARLTRAATELGFDVAPSQANFIWATHPERPVKPIFEQLRTDGVLVRYLDYPEWGDGLRMTVGSDAQVDVLIEMLGALMGSAGTR